jgi:hypothetical protein
MEGEEKLWVVFVSGHGHYAKGRSGVLLRENLAKRVDEAHGEMAKVCRTKRYVVIEAWDMNDVRDWTYTTGEVPECYGGENATWGRMDSMGWSAQ